MQSCRSLTIWAFVLVLCQELLLYGGTYFVEGSLAASLAASPWAPSKVPPGEVLRALAKALVESPTLRVHAVGQEGWELSSTTSWRVAPAKATCGSSAPCVSAPSGAAVAGRSPSSRGSLASAEGLPHVLSHLSDSI